MVLQVDVYTAALSIVILFVGYAVGKLFERFIIKAYERTISRRARESGLEEIEGELGFESGIRSLMSNLGKYIIYTIAILMVLDLLGLTTMSQILVELVKYSPNIFGAILILVFGIMAGEIAENITLIFMSSDLLSPAFKDIQINLSGTAGMAVKYYVYLVAVTMAVSQLGFAAMPLNVLVGVVSFAIAAGALVLAYLAVRDMLPNVSAGHYIRNRGFIARGDKVSICGISGVVEDVGPIFTRVRSRNKIYSIPNSKVMKEVVAKEVGK